MTTQKRPQNCGTSYCSCIECVMEPDYKALWEQMCERCDELDEKLAQPEHLEPVGEVVDALHDAFKCSFTKVLPVGTKLYTTPPQRKPLTDEQISAIEQGIWNPEFFDEVEIQANREFARGIEAAHGIKGNS